MNSRPYEHSSDFETVGRWLVRNFRPDGMPFNWPQPRWEYMHFHPLICGLDLSCIGIWEEAGEIIAVVHPEHGLGHAYFQFHLDHPAPKAEMLAHAEAHLSEERDGKKLLRLYIDDRDEELCVLARAAGYTQTEHAEVMSRQRIADAPAPPPVPAGFRLLSLADEDEPARVTRIFWRGFGHGEEPPDDALDDRRMMQSPPNYRRDLNLVIANEKGDYVAYGGIWFEADNRIAYIEPVATDPDFRRLGLAKIVVLESIRRCAELGAREVFVGADMPFYLALGFEPIRRWSILSRSWL